VAIVRELVTKLSFNLDKTNLDKFERTINSFKVKFAIQSSLIAKSVQAIFSFATGVADAAVQTKDLADYAGIAVDEFVALKNAAQQFSINPESFNAAIQKIAIGIKEASRGSGELLQIINETQGRINFKGLNGELLNAKDVLLQIFDEINRISDKSEKLRILGNIFDPQSAGAWLRAIEQGSGEFSKLIDKEKEFGKAFENSIPSFISFQKDVASLNNEFSKLIQTIAQEIVPGLTKAVSGTNSFVEHFKKTPKVEPEEIKEASRDFWRGLFGGKTNLDTLKEKQAEEDAIFKREVEDRRQAIQNRSSINITNNNRFEVNVPQGTTQEQGVAINQQIQAAFSSLKDEMAREVINNSPQVE
jgi:hypothetical protein